MLTENSSSVAGLHELSNEDILLGNIWRWFLFCGMVNPSRVDQNIALLLKNPCK